MPEDIVFGEINGMISCRRIESLMFLQDIDGFLLFEEIKCLNPCFFTFVSFVDNLFCERHFSVIGKGGDLFFQDGNKIGGIFSGNVDKLDHLFFDRHGLKAMF